MRANRAAFDALAHRAARAARRLRARHARRAVRPHAADAVPARARSACSSWCTATPTSPSRAPPPRRRADGLLQPGVGADGDVRRRDGRRAALVPALLEHGRRAGRELRRAAPRRAAARRSCVTLDTTMLGWRTRDLDLAYLPFLRGKGIAQYTSDPVFQRLLARAAATARRRRAAAATPRRAAHAAASMARAVPGAALAQPALGARARRGPALRRASTRARRSPGTTCRSCASARKLPILLKGVLHPDDARRAVDAGIDGLIVSNHGGRQVDGAIAIARRAARRRRGGRRPRAGAARQRRPRRRRRVQGARARRHARCCIGRPYAYGLALAGEARRARGARQRASPSSTSRWRWRAARRSRELDRGAMLFSA